VYLFRTVDVQQLASQLRQTRASWLALCAVASLAGIWARARRWWYLFPPGDEPPGLLAAMLIGYMANNVLPLRAGEVVRVVVVARRWGRGFWTVVATSIVERLLDSIAIIALLTALSIVLPVPRYFVAGTVTLLAVDVVAIAGLIAVAGWPGASRRFLARVTRRWPRVQAATVPMLDTFVSGLGGIRTPRRLPGILAWTVVVWTLPALVGWSALRAVNLDLPWIAGWTVLAFVGLSVSIPSAPGYIGVMHFAATKAVELFGVGAGAGLGFALVYHAVQFIPVTLVGWIVLLREPIRLGDAARAAELSPPRP
jgi:glycosyltransferase 2 family protein